MSNRTSVNWKRLSIVIGAIIYLVVGSLVMRYWIVPDSPAQTNDQGTLWFLSIAPLIIVPAFGYVIILALLGIIFYAAHLVHELFLWVFRSPDKEIKKAKAKTAATSRAIVQPKTKAMLKEPKDPVKPQEFNSLNDVLFYPRDK